MSDQAHAPVVQPTRPVAEVLVWDVPVRVFHWLLVFSVAGAWLNAESERWRWWHETLGYTTLGLMAGEPYSGEALVATDARVVMIPRAMFLKLIDSEPGFRSFVMTALGRRMQDVTRLLEQVAFASIESRLAAALLDMSEDNLVHATQAELAARIGSAREVVTRRLDAFQRAGWVATDRGTVRLLDSGALKRAASLAP